MRMVDEQCRTEVKMCCFVTYLNSILHTYVQLSVIDVARPGNAWALLSKTSNEGICSQVVNKGYVTCDLEKCESERLYDVFMPHGVSHHIGMDVHDYNNVSATLLPGMVFTVEVGLLVLFPCYRADISLSEYSSRFSLESILIRLCLKV